MATKSNLVPVTATSGDSVPSTPSTEGSPVHMSEPNVIKGVLLLMKQTIVAVILGLSAALVVPAVIAEAPAPVTTTETITVVEEKGWLDKAGDIWAGTKDRAVGLKDAIINEDERLLSARRMIEVQNEMIAKLQQEAAEHTIRVQADHTRMIYCARDLQNYLEDINGDVKDE